MKRQRDRLQLCLLSIEGGEGSVGCEQPHPEDPLPDHPNTNNEVEKRTGQREAATQTSVFYRFYNERRIFVMT